VYVAGRALIAVSHLLADPAKFPVFLQKPLLPHAALHVPTRVTEARDREWKRVHNMISKCTTWLIDLCTCATRSCSSSRQTIESLEIAQRESSTFAAAFVDARLSTYQPSQVFVSIRVEVRRWWESFLRTQLSVPLHTWTSFIEW